MTQDPASLHATVLLDEVVEWICPRKGGRYLDGTLGMGGHSLGLLSHESETELIGLDQDGQALDQAEKRLQDHADRTHLYQLPFSRFEDALDDAGWDKLDGAVLDLGVSSMQLDFPERGFSFLEDGPLDMRMDPGSGQAPASSIVNKAKHGELARIIRKYGDDPMAGKIASAILRARDEEEITTTRRLAAIVEKAYPAKMRRQSRTHPATRTFQALRIVVNRELEELEAFLERIPGRLAPGARIAIISFHSLEDRTVKHSFRREAKDCRCPIEQVICTCRGKAVLKVLTKRPVTASEAEVERNPRSRSAKLRVAERLPD